jgi:hypothetical protein
MGRVGPFNRLPYFKRLIDDTEPVCVYDLAIVSRSPDMNELIQSLVIVVTPVESTHQTRSETSMQGISSTRPVGTKVFNHCAENFEDSHE